MQDGTGPSPPSVTALLHRWSSGDAAARDEAVALVHKELVHLAARHLRGERAEHTLQPTALVNEAYMRLIALSDRDWANRAQFFAVASHLMRQILVDHARARHAGKRGGEKAGAISLDDTILSPASGDRRGLDLLDLHEALSELEKASPRTSRILELQVFGGLTVSEIASTLEISAATANRELRIGKAWLYDFIHRR